MATPVDQGRRPKTPATGAPHDVLRFHACERRLHWAIAIPFEICYLTALILVAVYNPAPARPFRDIFAWTYRLSGLCLALLPPLMLYIHRREFGKHLCNIREAWSWRLDALKWLLLMGPSAVSRRVVLPHQGKFNAAEKINFIVVMSTCPLYIATGLMIWFLRPAFASWMVHVAMAMAATPLVLGHVFMATVNPDTRVGLRGMISGWVSREWARHHYRRSYDEQFGPLEPAVQAGAVAEAAPPTTVRPPVPARPAVPVRPALPARPVLAPRPVAARPVAAPLPILARPSTPAGAASAGSMAPRRGTIVWPPEGPAGDQSFAS